mgnify:CR=1 FL=1
MAEATAETKVKVTRRVLVYGDGKMPGVDEPDEVYEGGETIETANGEDTED